MTCVPFHKACPRACIEQSTNVRDARSTYRCCWLGNDSASAIKGVRTMAKNEEPQFSHTSQHSTMY